MINQSYSTDETGTLGTYDDPFAAVDGSKSRSWSVTDYANSYYETNASGHAIGKINRDAPPTVYGGSWSFDGFHTYTRAELTQNFSLPLWRKFGKTVLATSRVRSFSSDNERVEWNVERTLGHEIRARFVDTGGAVQDLDLAQLATFGGGSFDKEDGGAGPVQQEDGSWNRSDVTTHYEDAYNPDTSRPYLDGDQAHTPWAEGDSLSFDGLALEGLELGYTRSHILQEFNEVIWAATGQLKLKTIANFSHSTDSTGTKGSFDEPEAAGDGSKSRSWTITDYNDSYFLDDADDHHVGELNRDAAPRVTGGSWSFDGFQTATRADLIQTFNGAFWHDFGKTVLLTSQVKSYSSTLTDSPTWDIVVDVLHRPVVFREINAQGVATVRAMDTFKTYGLGSYDQPHPQSDRSWSKSDVTTHYENAYDPETSRPYADGSQDHTPWASGSSLSFDGLALSGIDLGYSRSEISQEFNELIWKETGQLKLKTVINRSFSSNANGDGDYTAPVYAVDQSQSRSWTVTDYSNSYFTDRENGHRIGELNRDGAPTVKGGSWSFDGFRTYTRADLLQEFNGAIWHDTGKTVLLTSRVKSYSSTSDAVVFDFERELGRAVWARVIDNNGDQQRWDLRNFETYGADSYDAPHVQDDRSWNKSDITTHYEDSYDVRTGRPYADGTQARTPWASGTSLSFDGLALPELQQGYTRSDISQEFNALIWAATGQLKLKTVVNRSFNVDPTGTLGSYEQPIAAADGSQSRNWTVTDYSGSYHTDNADGHTIGELNRDAAPIVRGGSWSFDGFRTWTRADLEQTFAANFWHDFGKTVLLQSRVKSYSSDATGLEWNAERADNRIVARHIDKQGEVARLPMDAFPVYGQGTFDQPFRQDDGSWNKSDVTTYYDNTYDPLTSRAYSDGDQAHTPWASGTSISFDGLALTDLNSGYTQSDIFQEFNEVIWAATGQLKLKTVINRSYSVNLSETDNSYEKPGKAADGSQSRSWTVTDYSHSYHTDDGVDHKIGELNRDAAPTVYGGSWSFDGFRSWTRADLSQTFNAVLWHDWGKTVLYTSRVNSFSSNATQRDVNFQDQLGRGIVARSKAADKITTVQLDMGDFATYGEGEFNDPHAQEDGSWNKSEVTTHYENAYDSKTGRPFGADGASQSVTPWASGYSLSFDGQALPGTNQGYTRSDISQEFNADIWSATGQLKLRTVFNQSYSTDSTGTTGSYAEPLPALDRSQTRSWSVTDYSHSYYTTKTADHSIGELNRDAAPKVYGGSWSFDGVHGYTRADLQQVFNNDFWRRFGKTVLLTSRVRSFTSNAAQKTWDAEALLGHEIVARFGSGPDTVQTIDMGAIPVFGDGSFYNDAQTPFAPEASSDGSWNVSEVTTHYDNAYNPLTSQAYTDGALEHTPWASGYSVGFDGLALSSNQDQGYTRSDISQEFRSDIWATTGQLKLLTALNRSFSTDATGQQGDFDNPHASGDKSQSRSWTVTDYRNSYDAQGKIVRGSGRADDDSGTPHVYGGSWSFDGFNAYTRADLTQTFNGAIWHNLGKTVLLTSRVQSFTSDDSAQQWNVEQKLGRPLNARVVDAGGVVQTLNSPLTVYGGGTFLAPLPLRDGSWNRSDVTTHYEDAYDTVTSIPLATLTGRAAQEYTPWASGKSLSFDGLALADLNQGYTAGDISQEFNAAIWQQTNQLKLRTVLNTNYTTDATGTRGSYHTPEPSIDGTMSRSWSVTDYSNSYFSDTTDDHKTGQLNRDGMPHVYGGSWSFDGFRTYTRADLLQTFNATIWHDFGKTVLLQSRVRSYSSDVSDQIWDINEELGHDIVLRAQDENGNPFVVDTQNFVVYGNGMFSDPFEQDDGSWNKSEIVTHYENAYDLTNAQPIADATQEHTPWASGYSLSFDGLALQNLNQGYTRSDIFQEYRADVWKNTAQLKLKTTVNQSYTTNSDGTLGSYEEPFPATDGSYSRNWSVTDYSQSYDENGKTLRNLDDLGDASFVPRVLGGSWSFDGFQTRTRANLEQTFNTAIWNRFGKTQLSTSRVQSFSSNAAASDWNVNEALNTTIVARYQQGEGASAVIKELDMSAFQVYGDGSYEAPLPQDDLSWNKSDVTTYYDNAYNPQTSRPYAISDRIGATIEEMQRVTPWASGTSLSFDGLADIGSAIPLDQGYTRSDISQEFNEIIWRETGQLKLKTAVNQSYSVDPTATLGSYERPHTAADGSQSRSWTVTDYSNSYFTDNAGDHRVGQLNREAPPVVLGGSWNFDGFRSYTRADLTQTFNTQMWATFGKTVLLTSRVQSYSSSVDRAEWDVAETLGRTVIARYLDENGTRQQMTMDAFPVFGAGTYNAPHPQDDGSWNKSDITTHYEDAYDPETSRPMADGTQATTPWASGTSLSFDGLSLPGTNQGYTRSEISQEFNALIWKATGQLKLNTVVNQSFSVNATGDEGTYERPAAASDGSMSRSWTVTDYSNSYFSIAEDNRRIGQINRDAPPIVIGGSWSFDGFKTYTRADLEQVFNQAVWSNLGKTSLLTSRVKSYSSNDVAQQWNVQTQLGRKITARFINEFGDVDEHAMTRFAVYGEGSYDNALAQDDNSWNKSDVTTHYEDAYDATTSRPFADGTQAHTPWASGTSLSFDGLALGSLDQGYTKSDIFQEFNEAIWAAVGQLKLKTVVNRSYTTDASGNDGSYDAPHIASDGSVSRSWTVTDYKDSYDEMGRIVRGSGELNDPTGLPVVYGGSWSFDGFHTYTRADLVQRFNPQLWYNLGKTVLMQSAVASYSSNADYIDWNVEEKLGRSITARYDDGATMDALDMAHFGTYGAGSFDNPMPLDDGSWNKSYLTTHYENAYDPVTSKPLVDGTQLHTPWAEGYSLSFDGLALANLDQGYTRTDISQEFNEVIWSETGQLKLSTVVNRSYSTDSTGTQGSYEAPYSSLDGSQSRSWNITDYRSSYYMDDNGDHKIGELNRNAPPQVHGGSWSFDGFQTYTRADLQQNFSADFWSRFGKTVLLTSSVRSYSSNADQNDVNFEEMLSRNITARFIDAGGDAAELIMSAFPTYGAGTFETPQPQKDGSWNKSETVTHYENAYDPATSRPNTTGDQAHTPWADGWSLSFDGTALPGFDQGYTRSEISQEFNETIWKETGQLKLKTVLNMSYNTDHTGTKGNYAAPLPGLDGSMNRSWSLTDYSDSYYSDKTSGHKIGELNRNGMPRVLGGSWSYDGFRTWTRSDLKQIYSTDFWRDFGKTVLLTSHVQSYSSDAELKFWNIDADLGREVYLRFADNGGNPVRFNTGQMAVYGAGSFDAPLPQADTSWNKSETFTHYENSYDPATSRPYADGTPEHTPWTDGWSLSYDGTAFDPATNIGFTKSDIYQVFNPLIWKETGLAKLSKSYSRSFTSNAFGEGSYEQPFTGTADGSTSRSYMVTDYTNSYDNLGRLVRGSGDIDDQTGIPTTQGESLSFDGIDNITKTQITQKFNGAIWSTFGKSVLLESQSLSFSSDLSVTNGNHDDLWQTPIYGAGSHNDPVPSTNGSWSISDVITDYRESYDLETSRPLSKAPTARGTSLQYDGTAPDGATAGFGYTKTELAQVNSDRLWKEFGAVKLEASYSRSFSSNRAGAGTYHEPQAAGDGSISRSYSKTDYESSYDYNTGRLLPGTPPVVTGWSWNYDGLNSYTRTDNLQQFNPTIWAAIGRTVALTTRARSFSSDDVVTGEEDDGVAFGALGATTIYGRGTFETPVKSFDLSRSRSDIVTDYSESYLVEPGRIGHFASKAPTATGWSWNDSGMGGALSIGMSRSDVVQTFSDSIWERTGTARILSSVSKSYSSNNTRLGGDDGIDSAFGEGSFDQPFVYENENSFRGFSETSYDGSYDPLTGRHNPAKTPITNGWTLNFDGIRYNKTVSHQTVRADSWASLGKTVALESISQSFSSDGTNFTVDPAKPNWGGGSYLTPVVREDHAFDRSETILNFGPAYDFYGRTTDQTPIAIVQQDAGEVWKQSEFVDQADMDAQITSLRTQINAFMDTVALTVKEKELGATLREADKYDPDLAEVAAVKTELQRELAMWMSGRNASNTSYDDYHDFVLAWLDKFPALKDWKNTANFDVTQNIVETLYRSPESGSNARFLNYLKTNFSNGSRDAGVNEQIRAILEQGGSFQQTIGSITSLMGALNPSDPMLRNLSDALYNFGNTNTTKTELSWRSLSHTNVEQKFSTQVWKNLGRQAVEYRKSSSYGRNFDGTDPVSTVEVLFDIDSNTGLITSATGRGTTSQVDKYGNSQEQEFTQEYDVVLQEAKLLTQEITRMDSHNRDGSTTELIGTNVTKYKYDKYGRLTKQETISQTRNDDGFGNTTDSLSKTSHQIFANVAKPLLTETRTIIHSNDISETKTAKPSEMRYEYDEKGVLLNVSTDPSTTRTTDKYGNEEIRQNDVELRLFVGNQIRTVKVKSSSTSESADKSSQTSDSITVNWFKANGEMNDGITSTTRGSVLSDDGYGNLTTGIVEDGQGTFQESRNIAGFSKAVTSVNLLTSRPWDDSIQHVKNTVLTNYDSNGVLTGGTGTRQSHGQDAFGNLNLSIGEEEYLNLEGLMKLGYQSTRSLSAPLDESLQLNESKQYFFYELQKGRVVLTEVTGEDTVKSNDSWGNVGEGVITPTYKIINGKAVAVKTVSNIVTQMVSGATTTAHMVTRTAYDSRGRARNQVSNGESLTNDGFGSISWEQNIVQEYLFLKGRFALASVTSDGGYRNLDYTSGLQRSETAYWLDEKLHIIDAVTTTSYQGFDQYGNRTWSVTENRNQIINGAVKPVESTTTTQAYNTDGSRSTTVETRTIRYTDNGRLKGASSTYFVSGVNFDVQYVNEGETEMEVFFGELKATESRSSYIQLDSQGNTTSSSEVTRYFYTTMANWIQYRIPNGAMQILKLAGPAALPPAQQLTASTNKNMAPEISARFLGELTGANVFNKLKKTYSWFLPTKNITIYNTTSVYGPSVSEEVNGTRITERLAGTSLMRVTSESSGVGSPMGALSKYTVKNHASWAESEEVTEGTKSAIYSYDSNGVFVTGTSSSFMKVASRDTLRSGARAYKTLTTKTVATYAVMVNMKGKQVSLYSQTKTDQVGSIPGVGVQNKSSSLSVTTYAYDLNGRAMSSLTQDITDSESHGVFTHSESQTLSIAQFPAFSSRLDAIRTETYSRTENRNNGAKETTSVSESYSLTNRNFTPMGMVAAEGKTRTRTSQLVADNPTGEANDWVLYWSPWSYTDTVHKFLIYAHIGELSHVDITTGPGFVSTSMIHRMPNGKPIGATVMTDTQGSESWAWSRVVETQIATPWGNMLTIHSVTAAVTAVSSIYMFDHVMAIYHTSEKTFTHRGLLLTSLRQKPLRSMMVFSPENYKPQDWSAGSARASTGGRTLIKSMADLSTALNGPLAEGTTYGELLDEYVEEGTIPVRYLEYWTVAYGQQRMYMQFLGFSFTKSKTERDPEPEGQYKPGVTYKTDTLTDTLGLSETKTFHNTSRHGTVLTQVRQQASRHKSYTSTHDEFTGVIVSDQHWWGGMLAKMTSDGETHRYYISESTNFYYRLRGGNENGPGKKIYDDYSELKVDETDIHNVYPSGAHKATDGNVYLGWTWWGGWWGSYWHYWAHDKITPQFSSSLTVKGGFSIGGYSGYYYGSFGYSEPNAGRVYYEASGDLTLQELREEYPSWGWFGLYWWWGPQEYGNSDVRYYSPRLTEDGGHNVEGPLLKTDSGITVSSGGYLHMLFPSGYTFSRAEALEFDRGWISGKTRLPISEILRRRADKARETDSLIDIPAPRSKPVERFPGIPESDREKAQTSLAQGPNSGEVEDEGGMAMPFGLPAGPIIASLVGAMPTSESQTGEIAMPLGAPQNLLSNYQGENTPPLQEEIPAELVPDLVDVKPLAQIPTLYTGVNRVNGLPVVFALLYNSSSRILQRRDITKREEAAIRQSADELKKQPNGEGLKSKPFIMNNLPLLPGVPVTNLRSVKISDATGKTTPSTLFSFQAGNVEIRARAELTAPKQNTPFSMDLVEATPTLAPASKQQAFGVANQPVLPGASRIAPTTRTENQQTAPSIARRSEGSSARLTVFSELSQRVKSFVSSLISQTPTAPAQRNTPQTVGMRMESARAAAASERNPSAAPVLRSELEAPFVLMLQSFVASPASEGGLSVALPKALQLFFATVAMAAPVSATPTNALLVTYMAKEMSSPKETKERNVAAGSTAAPASAVARNTRAVAASTIGQNSAERRQLPAPTAGSRVANTSASNSTRATDVRPVRNTAVATRNRVVTPVERTAREVKNIEEPVIDMDALTTPLVDLSELKGLMRVLPSVTLLRQFDVPSLILQVAAVLTTSVAAPLLPDNGEITPAPQPRPVVAAITGQATEESTTVSPTAAPRATSAPVPVAAASDTTSPRATDNYRLAQPKSTVAPRPTAAGKNESSTAARPVSQVNQPATVIGKQTLLAVVRPFVPAQTVLARAATLVANGVRIVGTAAIAKNPNNTATPVVLVPHTGVAKALAEAPADVQMAVALLLQSFGGQASPLATTAVGSVLDLAAFSLNGSGVTIADFNGAFGRFTAFFDLMGGNTVSNAIVVNVFAFAYMLLNEATRPTSVLTVPQKYQDVAAVAPNYSPDQLVIPLNSIDPQDLSLVVSVLAGFTNKSISPRQAETFITRVLNLSQGRNVYLQALVDDKSGRSLAAVYDDGKQIVRIPLNNPNTPQYLEYNKSTEPPAVPDPAVRNPNRSLVIPDNPKPHHSYAIERPQQVHQNALRRTLSALGVPNFTGEFSSTHESAGVILVKRIADKLQPVGLKLFRTVTLASVHSGYPSERQLSFVGGLNAINNEKLAPSTRRQRISDLLMQYPDVVAQIENQESDMAAMLDDAEAFSTSQGIAVLDRAYEQLEGPFVPFHTHLSAPEKFVGLARFAPTPADLDAHRTLMRTWASAAHTSISLPGAILHASGEITLYWTTNSDSLPIRLEVHTSERIRRISCSPQQLKLGEDVGMLTLSETNLIFEKVRETTQARRIDLWDRRLSRPRVEFL